MTGPDGRCKAFDASANGFGRGEGCGVVMLKRLEDAVAHGDRILSVVRSMSVKTPKQNGHCPSINL
jgi:phthiocerol/phenolphthiocerol synthesis type-I polyketide synthase D